jgi:hydroxymethylglutaryl-CoA lyase
MSSDLESPNRIFFAEVGPRDGLQNLPTDLSTEIKVELIAGLLDCGPELVEATSFVSPKWVPKLADAEQVMNRLVADRGEGVLDRLRVLVPNRRGLERALAARARRVIANIGATEAFNRRNLNCSQEETLAEIGLLSEQAKAAGCLLDVSISVAFGCPFEGRVDPQRVLELALEVSDLEVAEISVADTIGVADPRQVVELVELLTARLSLGLLSIHLHDTRAMGLANALAAYRAGIRRFEGSVGGIGGCPFAPRATGNVCSEDLLHLLTRVGAASPVHLGPLCRVAERLEQLLGQQLPGRLYRAGIWNPDQLN